MALDWLKNDQRLKVVDNKDRFNQTEVKAKNIKPSPYKVKVVNDKAPNPEFRVVRQKEKGQLLNNLARANALMQTEDKIQLTGLTPQEEQRRDAIALKRRTEKLLQEHKDAYTGVNLFGKILNELPTAAKKTLEGAGSFALDVGRDTARAPLNVAAEVVKKVSKGFDAVGIPVARTDDFQFITEGNPITEFVFGKDAIAGFESEGERMGIEGSASLPVGILATGAEFIPGGGKVTRFVIGKGVTRTGTIFGKSFGGQAIHLADDVIGKVDDVFKAAKSADDLVEAEKLSKRAKQAVDEIIQRPKPTQVEKIDNALTAAKEQGHKVERMVQTKARGGRYVEDVKISDIRKPKPPNENYMKVEVSQRTQEIVGGTPQKSNFEFPTSIPKIQRPLISATGEISRYGEPGSELATRVRLARDTADAMVGHYSAQLKTVSSLRRAEWDEFYRALNKLDAGEELGFTPSPKVMQALEEWKKFTPNIRKEAVNVGLDPGDLGEWYFPRSYRKSLSSKKGREAAVNHLVDTGQAAKWAEEANFDTPLQAAIDIVGRYENIYKGTSDNVLGNLKFSRRWDLPEPDTGRDVIGNYLQGVAKSVGQTQYLGPADEIAHELIAQTAKLGYSPKDLANMLNKYNIAMGKAELGGAEAFKAFSRVAREFQAFIRLGAAAIANAGQATNSASVMGIWRQARGAFKGLSKANRQEIESMGVVSDQILTALREGHGFGRTAAGRIAAPFFQEIEKFNRISTAIAGADWAKTLAKKGDEASLRILKEKLNVTGPIAKKLTDQQLGEAARSIVNLTQFRVDPMDLPGWVASPGGKLVAQFRTFSYKQSGFLWNEVIKEAANGNVKPMARFLAVGIPMGIMTGKVRDVVKGRPSETPETAGGFIAEGIQNVGGYGMAGDVTFLWQTRKSANFAQYGAGVIGGPSAGFLVETLTNVGRAAQGQPESLQRQAIKAIPTAGPALQRSLMPTDFQQGGSTSSGDSGSGGRKSRSSSSSSSNSSTGSGGRKSRR